MDPAAMQSYHRLRPLPSKCGEKEFVTSTEYDWLNDLARRMMMLVGMHQCTVAVLRVGSCAIYLGPYVSGEAFSHPGNTARQIWRMLG